MISDILIADEFNQHDSNYMIIKKWIPENEQNILFDHTKKLRSRKLRMQSLKEPTTQWAGNQPLLVRKKSVPWAERAMREEHGRSAWSGKEDA